MRGFLSYVVRGRVHAVCASTLALIVSLVLMPVCGIAAGIVGLVTLRHGPAEGALVLGWTMTLGAVLSALLVQSFSMVVLIGVSLVLPAWLLSAVLRWTASQGATLAMSGALGALAFSAIWLFTGAPVAWWRAVLDRTLMLGLTENEMGGRLDPVVIERLNRLLDQVAAASYFSVWSMIFAMMTVLLARWWHAMLDNPGGFGEEFRALRMDRRVAFLTIGLGALALFNGNVAEGLGPILFRLALLLYVVQGIALVHGWVAHRKASTGWLVAMYVLLILPLPLGVLGLAAVGFSDAWLDYRSRWHAGA